MIFQKKSFLFALFVVGNLACGGSDSSRPSRSVIDGVWETACMPGDAETSHTIRYTFHESNTLLRRETFYADAACSQARGFLQHEGLYQIAVRQEVNFYEVDMRINKVYAEPTTAEGAAAWNAQHFCALTRWLPNVEENVISQSDPKCGVFGVSLIESLDLVLVDNDKSLTFGSKLNHQGPRPTQVNPSNASDVFHFVSH